MDKSLSSETVQHVLLEAVDHAGGAEDTLRIALNMVNDRIGQDGAGVDELVAVACVLDRVKTFLDKSVLAIESIRTA